MPCCGGSSVKNDKFSTFADACYIGNIEKMRERLKKEGGKNKEKFVNAMSEQDGMSPIHRAAQKGSPEALSFLIDNQADPVKLSRNGESPLFIACFHRQKEAVAALLKTPAINSINIPDKQHGMTPLLVAVYRGAPEIADMLLTAGADRTIKDKSGNDALSLAEFWQQQEQAGLSSPSAFHGPTLVLLQQRLGAAAESPQQPANF